MQALAAGLMQPDGCCCSPVYYILQYGFVPVVPVLGVYQHGYLCMLVHHVLSSGTAGRQLVLLLVLVLLVLTSILRCRSKCLDRANLVREMVQYLGHYSN